MEANAIMKTFGGIAINLAKNPLSIIALFIVFVHGFASMVVMHGDSLTPTERLPLIYFMILFPVLVLCVFAWLVSKHSTKLFGPGDYRNEENYIRMQLGVAASLAAATASQGEMADDSLSADFHRIVDTVRDNTPTYLAEQGVWRKSILWVDDRPINNRFERQAFEALGLSISLALGTGEAMEILKHKQFAVIISDMGRSEGPREGYVLLDLLRKQGNRTPFFIYAGSNLPKHKREATEHGAQGSTNDPQELFGLVTAALLNETGR